MQSGAEDLTPLATVSRASDVYIVRADAPFNTLDELFAHSRERELIIASQMGGTTQLKAEALAEAAQRHGGELRPVAIGSMANRLTALLGEQVDVSIVDLATARDYFEAGKAKPLAVISNVRDPFEPDWPTAAEQGVAIDLAQVGEIYAPAGLPAALLEHIDQALKPVLQDAEMIRELALVKQAPEYRDAAAAQAFIRSEQAQVAQLLEPQP